MKKYYCIDCKKRISKGHLRCGKCSHIFKIGENSSNFKTGKYIENLCIDCNKKISPEAIRCKSCAHKGDLNYKFKKDKIINKCIDCDKEIDYTAIRCKKCAKQGKLHPMFGKERPDSRQRMLGNKLGYINGKGYEPYTKEFSESLKELIRKRDNYICQGEDCSMTEEEHIIVYGRVLEIHHIDHNKQNCNEDNLVTLCKQCNIRANKNINYWQDFYKNKVTNKKLKENIK
jgi:DNA-directed RNA polymerase subunit RPC12/RpoP